MEKEEGVMRIWNEAIPSAGDRIFRRRDLMSKTLCAD